MQNQEKTVELISLLAFRWINDSQKQLFRFYIYGAGVTASGVL